MAAKRRVVIAVDFDGTCVASNYPKIGKSIGAEPFLRDLVSKGHRLILWTMRSGPGLKEAISWFAENKIELWSVNSNPEQLKWTDSPKAHADIYVDDRSVGIPLIYDVYEANSYVDWNVVGPKLVQLAEYRSFYR